MSQAAKAQEPSMEEILASIRRIIADDERWKAQAEGAAAVAASPDCAAPRAGSERSSGTRAGTVAGSTWGYGRARAHESGRY